MARNCLCRLSRFGDSGFVSNRSVEVEGHFDSTIGIYASDLPGEGTDQEKLDALLASDWELFDLLSTQVKYARKTPQERGLHLNQATSEVVEIHGFARALRSHRRPHELLHPLNLLERESPFG